MSKSPTLLSKEQIEKINAEALAAVKRGREALAKAGEARKRIGLTDEKLQQLYHTLSPGGRAWVKTAVGAGLAALTGAAPGAAKARLRRTRGLV